MQEKKTLFYFLYDSLKQQILSGCRQYGSPLPSLSRLCETYHVGRRTARDVLDALRREGLIHTEERKPRSSSIASRIPRKKIPLCVSFCSGNPPLSRFMKQWSC